MTVNESLATYADLAAYSATAVMAAAMVSFTVDLARTAPRAVPAQLVAAGSMPVTVSARPGPATNAGPDGAARVPRPGAGVGLALTWLGAGLLVAAAVMRGLSVGRVPWGNMFEFSLTGSAAVTVAFLVLNLRRDARWLGLFITGPVVLTLGLALTVFYVQASALLPSLRSFWLVIHVSIAILAVALFTLAAVVTVLQLAQSWREQRLPGTSGASTQRKPSVWDALPNSSSLEQLGYGLHVAAFPLWTFTLIAGAIWAQKAWGAYWQWDPKEVWTFIIWVVYAAYLHARATVGWSPRRVSIIALAGYGCIIVNYTVVNLYFVGMHSYSGM